MLQPEHNHIQGALALLVHQFSNKPRVCAVLTALSRQAQHIEDALWSLETERRLANAKGTQLDGLGRLVGLHRDGRSDKAYRTHVRARVLLNKSTGTPEEILRLVSVIAGPAIRLQLDEYFRSTFVLRLQDRCMDAAGSDIADLAISTKPAGSHAIVESFDVEPVLTFNGADDEGFGDDHDPSVGGAFASAQDSMRTGQAS